MLITGGSGALGALVARHLVERHGVRNLLLVSRRGAGAPGADVLVRELEAGGARVVVRACDVADRQELQRCIHAVPRETPLVAVIHTAGVIDDGVLDSLTPEGIDRVLAAKFDSALPPRRQATRLAPFVLFSSIAGHHRNPGQGPYAAANAALDALAHHRRANGLAATSVAWGPWADSGMAGRLSATSRARLGRMGLAMIAPEEALAALISRLRPITPCS